MRVDRIKADTNLTRGRRSDWRFDSRLWGGGGGRGRVRLRAEPLHGISQGHVALPLPSDADQCPANATRPPNAVPFRPAEAGKLGLQAQRFPTPARESACEGAGQTRGARPSWQGQWPVWFSWLHSCLSFPRSGV